MDTQAPQVIVIAGPNGAGKSTAALSLIANAIEFVNADDIARTLPRQTSEDVDIQAGRTMLQRLHQLQEHRESFAVETTLASRSLVPRLLRLKDDGYLVHLVFFWMPTPELCIERVAERVRSGGHHIPEETIRRRFRAGLWNFFNLYQDLADTWRMYNNTWEDGPRFVAEGSGKITVTVHDLQIWAAIKRSHVDEG